MATEEVSARLEKRKGSIYFYPKFKRSVCVMSDPQITTMLKINKLTREGVSGGESKHKVFTHTVLRTKRKMEAEQAQ